MRDLKTYIEKNKGVNCFFDEEKLSSMKDSARTTYERSLIDLSVCVGNIYEVFDYVDSETESIEFSVFKRENFSDGLNAVSDLLLSTIVVGSFVGVSSLNDGVDVYQAILTGLMADYFAYMCMQKVEKSKLENDKADLGFLSESREKIFEYLIGYYDKLKNLYLVYLDVCCPLEQDVNWRKKLHEIYRNNKDYINDTYGTDIESFSVKRNLDAIEMLNNMEYICGNERDKGYSLVRD